MKYSRIGYQGLRHEAANNTDLTGVEEGEYVKQIEIAKEVLKSYFLDHYVFTSDAASSCPMTDPHSSPAKFDFFADYRVGEVEASPAQEIDDFFRLRPLGFGKHKPDPIAWWKSQREVFPNLSRLARDILGIPCWSNMIASEFYPFTHTALTGSS